MSTEELFNAAVDVIRSLPKNGSFQPSHQLMLRFYAFYKQATEGPCMLSKPSFWDVVGKAKWESWKKLGDMPKEEAMTLYVEELKKTAYQSIGGLSPAEKQKIVETMSYSDKVENFMDILGPFYEMLDIGDKASDPGIIHNGHAEESIEIVNGLNGLDNSSILLKANMNVDSCGNLSNGIHDQEISNEQIESNGIHDQVMMITKDGATEKYYSDSDSENDEFSDPIEIQTDEKILKKHLIDHNDNDSGFADQVENNIRQPQNGHGSILIEDQCNQLWALSKKAKDTGQEFYNDYVEENKPFINNHVRNDHAVEEVVVKGVMARGGGDEDQGLSGSSGPRRTTPPQERRGRSHRGSLNHPELNPSSSQPLSGVGSNGRSPGGGFLQQQPMDINEQIAMALLRLQRDMDSVLARLNVLETVALAQHNTAQERLAAHYNATSQLQTAKFSGPSWWPFKDIKFRTFLFFIAWPILLQIIIKIIANRRARRFLRKC